MGQNKSKLKKDKNQAADDDLFSHLKEDAEDQSIKVLNTQNDIITVKLDSVHADKSSILTSRESVLKDIHDINIKNFKSQKKGEQTMRATYGVDKTAELAQSETVMLSQTQSNFINIKDRKSRFEEKKSASR